MEWDNKNQTNHTGSLLLRNACLLRGLCHLSSGTLGLVDGFDDSDSDSLPHITHSETSKRGIVSEGLDAERLGGDQLDDSSVSRLEELRVVLNLLSGTAVDLRVYDRYY